MLECLIIGDSIAQGIAQAKPECAAIVRSGITTKGWFQHFENHPTYKERAYRIVVISLSTNDMYNGLTSEYLFNVRNQVKAHMVIWIAPSNIRKPKQYQMVKEIANEFKDRILDISSKVGSDGIHPPTPTAYRDIAKQIF